MLMISKKQYFQQIVRRYHRSSKRERSKILDEFCAVCEYNRSYAYRLLNEGHKRKKPGRRSKYDNPEFVRALPILWRASDFQCGKRLYREEVLGIRVFEQHGGE